MAHKARWSRLVVPYLLRQTGESAQRDHYWKSLTVPLFCLYEEMFCSRESKESSQIVQFRFQHHLIADCKVLMLMREGA